LFVLLLTIVVCPSSFDYCKTKIVKRKKTNNKRQKKKDKQHNRQKKKEKQHNSQKKKGKQQ
jgi:uncharacterized ion transporter superfamily protein YfcC